MSLQILKNFFKPREKIPLETCTQKKDKNYQHEKDSTDNIEKTEIEGNSISSELGQPIIDFPLRHIDEQNRKFNADINGFLGLDMMFLQTALFVVFVEHFER
jgi:hypothetical protein